MGNRDNLTLSTYNENQDIIMQTFRKQNLLIKILATTKY